MSRSPPIPPCALLLVATVAATASAAADLGDALLDLATCRGPTPPVEALEGEEADRRAAVDDAYDAVRDPDRFRPSELPDFWVPVGELSAGGFPVRFFGTEGFGIFEGPNLILAGAIDEVREALAEGHELEYGHCRAQSPVAVCATEVERGRTRLVMGHPTEPDESTVLICVERMPAREG